MRALGVVVLLVAAAAALAWWQFLGRDAPVPPDPLLHLPEAGARITLVQRHDAEVPGSAGAIRIHIGDITSDQVDLTISRADGTAVVATRSVREGDRIEVPYGARRYRLAVVEFRKALVGDDEAVLDLTDGPSERDRIEALLKAMEGSGLVFLRNGAEHDGPAAAAHLRRKLDAAGDRVRTARDFIDGIATRSSMSGEPYRVRLADGGLSDLAPWLTERLAGTR